MLKIPVFRLHHLIKGLDVIWMQDTKNNAYWEQGTEPWLTGMIGNNAHLDKKQRRREKGIENKEPHNL